MVRVKSKVDSTAFFARPGGQFAPNSGGQFTPNWGGQFRPEQVVSLNRIGVVNFTEFSTCNGPKKALLQVRTKVLNKEWEDIFRKMYPDFRPIKSMQDPDITQEAA